MVESKLKHVLAINGSASKNSRNQLLIDFIATRTINSFKLTLFHALKELPHFDPDLSLSDTPKSILDFRKRVEDADGILICSPEYVFSIPSGLKNALEWCVSTTVFQDKPIGIITASASGEKAHAELQLIMETLMAKVTPDTSLLIRGVKTKVSENGAIVDIFTSASLAKFIESFKLLIHSNPKIG